MESARTGPGGRLRVSSSVALARRRLVPALGAFTRAHAGLCVELLGTDRYVDFFKEPLDVALRVGRLADSSLMAVRLASDRKVVCAAPSYLGFAGTPKRPRDLLRHNCLRTQQRALNEWTLGNETISAAGAFEAETTDMLIDAALSAIGIGRFSSLVVAPLLEEGRLVEILADYPSDARSALYAIVPSGDPMPPKVRAFVDFVTRLFRPSGRRR